MLAARRWLPLVAPRDLPAGPLEPQTEAADAGEQLDDPAGGHEVVRATGRVVDEERMAVDQLHCAPMIAHVAGLLGTSETTRLAILAAMGSPLERARQWHQRWHALLPILVVEFVVLLGFGALLPILPFYVVEHGIDIQTLGLITAAWGLAKLVSEPIFGFLADHTSRKPLMILGLAFLGVFTILPLVFTSAAALFVLRLLSGASAGAYDPPARGIIVDSTPEGERGEAFGLYSAAQMGGFLVGPVIGAVGASLGGGYAFPFLLTGGLALLSAVYLAVALPSHRTGIAQAPAPVAASADAEQSVELALEPDPEPRAPLRALADRLLIAAVLMNFGFAFSAGIYEVIWSLFMDSLGASISSSA